jgi:hypothetical protein
MLTGTLLKSSGIFMPTLLPHTTSQHNSSPTIDDLTHLTATLTTTNMNPNNEIDVAEVNNNHNHDHNNWWTNSEEHIMGDATLYTHV